MIGGVILLNNLVNPGKSNDQTKSAAQEPTVHGNAINTTPTSKGIESLLKMGTQKMQEMSNNMYQQGAGKLGQPIKFQRGKAIREIFPDKSNSAVTKAMKPASPMMSPELRALS